MNNNQWISPDNSNYHVLEDDNSVRQVPYEEWLDFIRHTPMERFLVAKSYREDNIEVSTVFIHTSPKGQEPALVFETLVFKGPFVGSGYRTRYRSWTDAIAGHKKVLEQVESDIENGLTRLSPSQALKL